MPNKKKERKNKKVISDKSHEFKPKFDKTIFHYQHYLKHQNMKLCIICGDEEKLVKVGDVYYCEFCFDVQKNMSDDTPSILEYLF